MKTRTLCFSGLLRTMLVLSMLFLITSFTATTANAAQGCGQGYHRSFHGGCIVNYPGAWARPAPYHPGCWRNWAGALRCP